MNLLICSWVAASSALQYPSVDTFGWSAIPVLHQPHDSRSTEDRILLLWSAGVHVIGATLSYEVQIRWPTELEAYDWQFYPTPSSDGAFPTNRDWAIAWSGWTDIYSGAGRQFEFRFSDQIPAGLVNQRVFEFQVRAVCDMDAGCYSDWSNVIQTHLALEGRVERFGIELIGTGRNNAGISQINVNGVSVFARADSLGLTMAVFDRTNFSLVSVDTYDTHNEKSESTRLANDVRAIGPQFFIAIVSCGAWEWNFTPTAASALEQIGGYYVGQWARVYSVSSIQFNPYSDIAETFSQDSFGHPYALLGYFGLGMGNGWESLQLNSGHYLALGKAEHAIIRLGMYYNYFLGRYIVGISEDSLSSSFYTQSQLPITGTVHAPVPASRTISAAFQVHAMSAYAPYIGNLWNQLEYIMETNETVFLPQYNTTNFGFEIVIALWLPSPLVANDPRSGVELETELERMWGGPTARVSGINSSQPLPGAVTVSPYRPCPDALADRFEIGSCSDYDNPTLTANSELMQFGVGMWPVVCFDTRAGCEEPPIATTYTEMISAPQLVGSATVLTDVW